MNKTVKILFTFTSAAKLQLESIRDKFNVDSLASALQLSLSLTSSLQKQFDKGYTQVIVRNPNTGDERSMRPRGL